MALFTHSRVNDTQDMRPMMTPTPSVEVALRTDGDRTDAFPVIRRYTLEVRFAVDFWCNGAQLPRATKTAKDAIAEIVYRDIRQELHNLRLCIMGGDVQGAMSATDAIEAITRERD